MSKSKHLPWKTKYEKLEEANLRTNTVRLAVSQHKQQTEKEKGGKVSVADLGWPLPTIAGRNVKLP